MPDLEAATAMLEADTATGSDSEVTDTAAPPSGDAASESEPVAVPSPAIAREAKLRAQREERRAKLTEQELAAIRAKAQDEAKAEWKQRLRTNARAALAESDDPAELYTLIHESAVNKDSPEYQTKKAIEEAREEAKKAREENAALRAAIDAERRQAVVGQFLSEASKEDWADTYDEDELIANGDRIANELSKAGERFGIPEILARLKREHIEREQRVAARRAKRAPKTPATQTAATNVQAAQEPTAIGNQLVSETASASSGKLTKEQRFAAVDEMIRAPRRRAG